MKVTDVERITCDVPFVDEPQRNMTRQHDGWHIAEVCRVETDEADGPGRRGSRRCRGHA